MGLPATSIAVQHAFAVLVPNSNSSRGSGESMPPSLSVGVDWEAFQPRALLQPDEQYPASELAGSMMHRFLNVVPPTASGWPWPGSGRCAAAVRWGFAMASAEGR